MRKELDSRPNLILIRHAQSSNNALPEPERVCDPAITDLGHLQAQAMADSLNGVRATELLTSAFRRALQTASYLNHSLGLCPEVVVDLHEHGGCYDGWEEGKMVGRPGLTTNEIGKEFGNVKLPADYPVNGWWSSRPRETHDQSDQRAIRVAKTLKERLSKAEGHMVCVSHADFLSKLLLAMLGESIDADERFWDLKNVGVSAVYFDKNKWHITELNSVDFLPRELVSS